jgi:Chemoreceptor zinc-binding domain
LYSQNDKNAFQGFKMGLFDVFRKAPGSEAEPAAQPAEVAGELSGLNLRQALDAHSAWKERLTKVIEGSSDEKPDIAIVVQDNQCFLGKWLYAEGKRLHGHLPEYESLREAHAEFHVCAGHVLEQHQLGNETFAKVILKSKFRTASNKNQMLLTSLFVAAKL